MGVLAQTANEVAPTTQAQCRRAAFLLGPPASTSWTGPSGDGRQAGLGRDWPAGRQHESRQRGGSWLRAPSVVPSAVGLPS